MTFNIRGAFAQDGVNAWENRAALNVATIALQAPALIGFQELHAKNLATYRQCLSGYQWFLGPEADKEALFSNNAIFWRPEDLLLLEAGGFWLSETPNRWSRGWNASLVRAATWARFECVSSGIQFLHLNTHLDHASSLARLKGCRLILHQIEQLGGTNLPIILTGDFNASAPRPGERWRALDEENPYQILTQGGFSDTFFGAHPGVPAGGDLVNTFHNFEGDAFVPWDDRLTVRIDWILARDGRNCFQVDACTIVRDHEPPLYPSDHYPVVADLSLRNAV